MSKKVSAIFSVTDHISETIAKVAQAGMDMVEQLERAGDIASGMFDGVVTSASATASSVDGVATSLDTYSSSASSAADQTDYWTEAIGNYDKSAMEAIWTTEELVEEGYKTQEALEAEQTASQEAEEALDKLAEQSRETGDSQEEMGEKGENAAEQIANALTTAGVAVLVKEVAEAFMEASNAAAEFETGVMKISTIADTAAKSMEDISGEITDLSMATGERVGGLSEATYSAISASVDTANAVQFTATATKLAGGGFTDAATSVDVLTTALNAYKLEADDAEKIADMLITTQNLGKTSVNELAASVGKVIPLASAYGVEMDNLSASYAELTKGGIATAEAGTYLKSMLNELGDSGSAVSAVLMEQTGSTFAQLMEQGNSLGDVMTVLGESVNGNSGAFNELWSSSEAGIGALSLYNAGAEQFNATLDAMQSSVGATETAYATMTGTTAHAQEEMSNAAQNMNIAIGGTLNPLMEKLYDTATNIMNAGTRLVNEHPVFAKVITATSIGFLTVATAISAVGAASATLKTVVPAVVSFGTAVNAALGPIGWAAIGITALVAAGTALVTMLDDAEDETAGMTAVTRAQYYQLQDLNAEYEDVCEKYGETSEEASRLKYQVDDLSAAFDMNRQTVEEFTAEVDALSESVDKLWTEYNSGMDDIRSQEVGALSLIQKYEDLATQAHLTETQEKELEAVTKRLSESYPDLAAQLDKASGGAVDYAEAMRQACEQQAEQQRLELAQDSYVEGLMERERLTEELAKAQENLNAEMEANNIIDNGDGTYGGDWAIAWQTDFAAYRDAIDELNEKIAENEAGLAEIEELFGNLARSDALDKMSEGIIGGMDAFASIFPTYQEAVNAAIDSTKDRIGELCAAYDEVYQSALASLEGQFGLFDKASMESETYMNATVANAQAALESQLAYWDNYQANLEVLKATSAADLGITQENYEALMAYAQGGTEEAAGLSASLAEAINSGNIEAVAELANTVGEVSAKQQEVAATTADWVTDFTHQMDEVEREMQATIEGMNLSDEAADSATATINAYVSSIRSAKGNAVAAAQEVATAVAAALQTQAALSLKVNTAGTVTGYARGTTNAESAFLAGEEGPELILRKLDAFANGTTDSPNAFIAGDDGPELILGQQGSTVFPTEETDRLIHALNDRPETAPVLMETGGSNTAPQSAGGQVKRIFLEINGSGKMEVGGDGVDKETILDVLMDNARSVFMGLLQEEAFEEGDMVHDY